MSHSRAGRRLLCRGRGWFRCLLALATAVACAAASGSALAGSGGAGVPSLSGAPSPTSSSPRTGANPLGGRGMWIWYVSASSGGNLSSIISAARSSGLSTVIVKSGDGTTAWSQFNPQLVASLHRAGLRVCAWQYVYGNHPLPEAQVGAAAVKAGANCLVIDAESEYEGKYVQAQEYMKKLRQLIGTRYPVALAGFPYVDYHPGFPYSVFLGPGGAQYNTPQMYWADIGTSVDAVYAHTYEFNVPYQRPVEPLGEVAGNPAPAQVLRFRQLSRAYGATGVSWWDWQESSQRDWRAIGQPVGNLSGAVTPLGLPVLSLQGAGGIWAGDLVVWAQEHLVSAGVPVQIDGSFGTLTQSAVEQFQAAHGLPATGMVDATTWPVLLGYQPVAVTWTKQHGKTVALAARGGLELEVPWSAHLRARRYEIPRDLGAGRRPPG
jgi:Putative peptidoglycan binding domain